MAVSFTAQVLPLIGGDESGKLLLDEYFSDIYGETASVIRFPFADRVSITLSIS